MLADQTLESVPLSRRVGAALHVILGNLGLDSEQRCEVLGIALWPPGGPANNDEPVKSIQEEREEAVALVLGGVSRADVAMIYGVSEHTIGGWVRAARR